LVIFLPNPAASTQAGPGPAQAPLFTAGHDGGTHQSGGSESAPGTGPAATEAQPDEPTPASIALAAAAATKAKLRAASLTIAYQIGEPKVRLPRDTVLATQPTERASNQMMAEARVQAWNNNQSAKPESFRKPVITGGWSFRPARGATWPKPPVWLDTLTDKPVEGLRVSANGLHLTWNGLVPTEAFSAHILDEEGNEQARLTYTADERRFEVTTNPVFAESAPVFSVELTPREAVAGTLVWRSRTPTWSDARWETQLQQRQIKLTCLQPLPKTKEPVTGVVALTHPSTGWILSWDVSLRPTATPAAP
jgi:hypothetical protein